MSRAPSLRRRGAVPDARTSPEPCRTEVVRAPAVLDLAGAPRLADSIAAARRRHPRRLVVDLDAVEFCDSTGLAVLVEAADDLVEERCSLELRDPPHVVVRTAALLGLSVRLGLPG